jgi:hypothetical protein
MELIACGGLAALPLWPTVAGACGIAFVSSMATRLMIRRRQPAEDVVIQTSCPGALAEQRAWYRVNHQRWGTSSTAEREILISISDSCDLREWQRQWVSCRKQELARAKRKRSLVEEPEPKRPRTVDKGVGDSSYIVDSYNDEPTLSTRRPQVTSWQAYQAEPCLESDQISDEIPVTTHCGDPDWPGIVADAPGFVRNCAQVPAQDRPPLPLGLFPSLHLPRNLPFDSREHHHVFQSRAIVPIIPPIGASGLFFPPPPPPLPGIGVWGFPRGPSDNPFHGLCRDSWVTTWHPSRLGTLSISIFPGV